MKTTYRSLLRQEGVLVKVPQKSLHMRSMEAFKIGRVTVPARWQNGMPLKGGVVLNRHFFGVENGDFGRRIVAAVEVMEKTTPEGRKFTMLNITKVSIKPTHELKIADAAPKDTLSIQVLKTDKFICFKSL